MAENIPSQLMKRTKGVGKAVGVTLKDNLVRIEEIEIKPCPVCKKPVTMKIIRTSVMIQDDFMYYVEQESPMRFYMQCESDHCIKTGLWASPNSLLSFWNNKVCADRKKAAEIPEKE